MMRVTGGESESVGAKLEHADVKAVTDAGFIVHGPAGVMLAQAARGCLIQPEVSDRVLLSSSGHEAFILTVLSRERQEQKISVSGDLNVSAGRLSLSGQEGVTIFGERFTATATETCLSSKDVTVWADSMRGCLGTVRVFAKAVEVSADRAVNSARKAIRRIADVEVVYAGNVIQRVRENFVSRAKRTSMTARKDVHIDGERIHMG